MMLLAHNDKIYLYSLYNQRMVLFHIERIYAMDAHEEIANELAYKEALQMKHKQYLEIAELQAASFGISPPVSLALEIKDIKKKIATLEHERLNLHNHSLKHASRFAYKKVEHALTTMEVDDVLVYELYIET